MDDEGADYLWILVWYPAFGAIIKRLLQVYPDLVEGYYCTAGISIQLCWID
jgi:hypothetical protein